MRIVTLNAWGRNGAYEMRAKLILKELAEIRPDMICFQEVFDSDLPDRIAKKNSSLSIYASYPAGLVIASRYEIKQMFEVPYKTISPIESSDRRAIFAKFEIGNQPIWIGNTHLSWKPEDHETRLGQTEELEEVAAQLDAPAILCGDFNCTPDSEPVSKLKQAGFVELFEFLHPEENGFTWDNDRNPYLKKHSVTFPNRRIDLFLVSRNIVSHYNSISCELFFATPDSQGVLPSDHFGVAAKFGE